MSPSGKVHLYFWKSAWWLPVIAANLCGLAFILKLNVNWLFIALGILLGYGLGWFLDPDLDLVGTSSAEGRMLNLPILGIIWVTYWTPYGAIFRKNHRSEWTHSYVWSTLIRFVYQFFWLPLLVPLKIWIWLVILGSFVGLCIADGVHIWADRNY